MLAFFQSDGKTPEERDFVKIICSTGEISSAHSLSTNGGILSGPCALFASSSNTSCHIPSTENVISGKLGNESSASRVGTFD